MALFDVSKMAVMNNIVKIVKEIVGENYKEILQQRVSSGDVRLFSAIKMLEREHHLDLFKDGHKFVHSIECSDIAEEYVDDKIQGSAIRYLLLVLLGNDYRIKLAKIKILGDEKGLITTIEQLEKQWGYSILREEKCFMITLTEWYLTKHSSDGVEFYLFHGFVNGHPTLEDGIFIHTSAIQNIRFEENRLIARTRSNHDYELSLSEVSFEKIEKTRDNLQYFNVPASLLDKCKELRKEVERAILDRVSTLLQKNELYLRIKGTSVDKAFFKDNDDNISEIESSYYVGMHIDSIMISNDKVDFRYFPYYWGIVPYHWSDGLEAIKIDNQGSKDIGFRGSNGIVICEVDEITTIQSTEYTGEGLLTPDLVNGKCAAFSDDDE